MTEPQSALLLRRQLAGNETLVLTDAGCLANGGSCADAAVSCDSNDGAGANCFLEASPLNNVEVP